MVILRRYYNKEEVCVEESEAKEVVIQHSQTMQRQRAEGGEAIAVC